MKFKKFLLSILLCCSFGMPLYSGEPTYFFKSEPYLESKQETNAKNSLKEFLAKGGTFHSMPYDEISFDILPRDAVYPADSGGWCRSQTLYYLLEKYQDLITLFPPHATRYGWDPYNDQINRYRNCDKEEGHDGFASCFHQEKSLRMGFENNLRWKAVEINPTGEGIEEIRAYYNEHYYGPTSAWHGKHGARRVYIAFASNAHVVLERLNQTNDSLSNVHVVAMDVENLAGHPPEHLQASPNSKEAYQYLADLLSKYISVEKLKVDIHDDAYSPSSQP